MIKLNDIQIKVTKILGEEFGANMEKILKIKGFECYRIKSPKTGKSIPTYNYFNSLKVHGSEERIEEIKNAMLGAIEAKQQRIQSFIDSREIMTEEDRKKLDYFQNKKPQLTIKIIDGVLSLALLCGKMVAIADVYEFEVVAEKTRKTSPKKAKTEEPTAVEPTDIDEFDEFANDAVQTVGGIRFL